MIVESVHFGANAAAAMLAELPVQAHGQVVPAAVLNRLTELFLEGADSSGITPGTGADSIIIGDIPCSYRLLCGG